MQQAIAYDKGKRCDRQKFRICH